MAEGNHSDSKKIILLGETAVGKTSLILQFVNGTFAQEQPCSVGVNFFKRSICIDKTNVNFEIWDTAGQERFQALIPMYCREAQAALVVYDITNEDSFNKAKEWLEELKKNESTKVIGLAGNKFDLRDVRTVNFKEAKQYADKNGLVFLETSAKTNENVHKIFEQMAKRLCQLKSEPKGIKVSGIKKQGCCKK